MAVLTTAGPGAALGRRDRQGRRGRSRRARYGDLRTALVFLIPATIGFVTFYLVPAVRGAWFSLIEYSVLTPPRYVGLENYERLVQDPLFWNEPGFDKDDVAVYGLGYNESGGGYGQVQWAPFALSNGWSYSDRNPWPTEFNYDDPALAETIGWWRSLIDKGYMPSLAAATSGVGSQESLGAGAYASLIEGSWNARAISELGGADFQVAPTPVGPSGERGTVFNGLSDAIYAGTPHPDEAWAWVEHLASPDCQLEVAKEGRVFPAVKEASAEAVATFEELGVDAEAFSVHVADGTTTPSPVTDWWAQLQTVMQPTMDSVLSFQAEPESLAPANDRVNALPDD
jgi:multiple sugar transport system substrate-binding protein